MSIDNMITMVLISTITPLMANIAGQFVTNITAIFQTVRLWLFHLFGIVRYDVVLKYSKTDFENGGASTQGNNNLITAVLHHLRDNNKCITERSECELGPQMAAPTESILVRETSREMILKPITRLYYDNFEIYYHQ